MLFQMRKPKRYDGIVTAQFEDGTLTHLEANACTDYDWVSFLENMIADMQSVYPDSGSDGIAYVADKYFVKSSIDVFYKAMDKACIKCDRDMCAKYADYDTVCAIIDALGILVDDE